MSSKGRPAKSPEQKQSISINVRFTPEESDELDWLLRQAEIAGGMAPLTFSPATYIRSLILKHAGWTGDGWLPKPIFGGNKTLPGFLALDPSVLPSCENGTIGCNGLLDHDCSISAPDKFARKTMRTAKRAESPSKIEADILKQAAACIAQARRKHPNATESEIEEVASGYMGDGRGSALAITDSQVLQSVTNYVNARLDRLAICVDGSKTNHPAFPSWMGQMDALRVVKDMLALRVEQWPGNLTEWAADGGAGAFPIHSMLGLGLGCCHDTPGCTGGIHAGHECHRTTRGLPAVKTQHKRPKPDVAIPACINGNPTCIYRGPSQKHVCRSQGVGGACVKGTHDCTRHGDHHVCLENAHRSDAACRAAAGQCCHGTEGCAGKGEKHAC
jgi:hypothetical protein